MVGKNGTKGRGREMKQIGSCKIHFLSEAVSPITHMGGVSGNESILNREKVVYKNQVVDVTMLSGNALRHRLVREPGAVHLVDACGLRGKLNIDQANFMFTGGSLCESATSDNIPLIAKMQIMSPLFRLLGGSLKNQIVGGSLFVSRGLLVCEENIEVIRKMCPEVFESVDGEFLPAQSFISKYQYTRGDVMHNKDAADIVAEVRKDGDKQNLMIYSGESIIPGSMFYHNMTLYNVSPLEVGALLNAVHLWQLTNGTIGGSSRIGHGKLDTVMMIDGLVDWFGSSKDPVELVKDYCSHVYENSLEFESWLNEAFGGSKSTKKISKKTPQLLDDGAF
jgi:hypothetical protein